MAKQMKKPAKDQRFVPLSLSQIQKNVIVFVKERRQTFLILKVLLQDHG
jgi:hypothetical protein